MTTNANRAEWAESALRSFVAEVGGDDDDVGLGDLIADLFHLCDERGISKAGVLERAARHYAAEVCTEDPEHLGCAACDAKGLDDVLKGTR